MSTFASPGAGSTTTVRSSPAVHQTRRPSTSASKSGKISSSSSISTVSRRTSSIWLLGGTVLGFRFESMFISQIPDQEQYQTQQQPGNQVRRKDKEGFSDARPHAAAQFEEDRGPDQGGNENARCKNPIRDPQYSRNGRDDDPHARDVPADDDRPGSPSFIDTLSPAQTFLGDSQVSAVALDEWPAVAPADGQVASTAQHGSRNDRQVRQRIRDGSCGGQIPAVRDGNVAWRRPR